MLVRRNHFSSLVKALRLLDTPGAGILRVREYMGRSERTEYTSKAHEYIATPTVECKTIRFEHLHLQGPR